MKRVYDCYAYGKNLERKSFEKPVFFENSKGDKICFEKEFLDKMYQFGATPEDIKELWECEVTNFDDYYSVIQEDINVSWYEKRAIEDCIDDPVVKKKVRDILQNWTNIAYAKEVNEKRRRESGESSGFKGSIIDLPPGRGVFF